MLISDTMTEDEIDARIDRLNNLVYERVGLTLRPDMAALGLIQAGLIPSLPWSIKLKPKATAL